MEQLSVVISGFDAYENVDVNPSREVPLELEKTGVTLPEGDEWSGVKVTSVILPLSFAASWPLLLDTIRQARPQVIIATGLKRRNRGIALERCATNLMDADKPDADNVQPRRTPIDPTAPAAYWTQLPLRKILSMFAEQKIPATLSSDAGTFICNSLFYQLLNWSVNKGGVLAGFLSFPLINESGDEGGLGIPLAQMELAARDVVEAAARYYARPSDSLLELV